MLDRFRSLRCGYPYGNQTSCMQLRDQWDLPRDYVVANSFKARGSGFYHLYPTGRGTVRLTFVDLVARDYIRKKVSADKLLHFTHVSSKCSANLASLTKCNAAILVDFSASFTLVIPCYTLDSSGGLV